MRTNEFHMPLCCCPDCKRDRDSIPSTPDQSGEPASQRFAVGDRVRLTDEAYRKFPSLHIITGVVASVSTIAPYIAVTRGAETKEWWAGFWEPEAIECPECDGWDIPGSCTCGGPSPVLPGEVDRRGFGEERYWCGCIREARWTRCEQHTEFEHDEEPDTRRYEEQKKTGCRGCGRPYGDEHGFPDLVVPDDVWRLISPSGDEGGLLCPSCICARAYRLGITNVRAVFRSGPFCEPDPPTDEEVERLLDRLIGFALAGHDHETLRCRREVLEAFASLHRDLEEARKRADALYTGLTEVQQERDSYHREASKALEDIDHAKAIARGALGDDSCAVEFETAGEWTAALLRSRNLWREATLTAERERDEARKDSERIDSLEAWATLKVPGQRFTQSMSLTHTYLHGDRSRWEITLADGARSQFPTARDAIDASRSIHPTQTD